MIRYDGEIITLNRYVKHNDDYRKHNNNVKLSSQQVGHNYRDEIEAVANLIQFRTARVLNSNEFQAFATTALESHSKSLAGSVTAATCTLCCS